MKISDLIPSTLLSSPQNTEIYVQGVSDHTEHIAQGDLFICRPGTRFNPALLLPVVAKRGASAIVIEEGTPHPAVPIPCIQVKSARMAEAEIWRRLYRMPERDMRLIGVTGTNGKTTTAKILSHILTESEGPCGYLGTLGASIGKQPLPHLSLEGVTTPSPAHLYRTLRYMNDNGARTVVMEVSSHALSQMRTLGLSFEYGLFTNLTEDHLDYHGTMEDYFAAKCILFRQSKHSVINLDDPYGKRLFASLNTQKTACGIIENTPYRIEDLYEKEGDCTKYTCITPSVSFALSYPLFGAFNVYNTLMAVTTALLCGACPEQIRRALQTLPPISGRMELLSLNAPFSVIIDYAHTPDAMAQAIKAARMQTKGRLLVLFGAGGDREKEKRSIMGQIAEENADFCIVTSDNTRSESPFAILSDVLAGMHRKEKRQVISNRRQAICTALSLLRPADTLLLLGKGHESYLITKEGKEHFSEKEIVEEYVTEHKDLWS